MKRLFLTALCMSALAAVSVLSSGEEARKPTASPSPAVSAVPAGEVAVPDVQDTVVLKDGTVLKGRIIAAGKKAVVILIETAKGPSQRSVPRDRVKEIRRGKAKPKSDYYETGIVDGSERITRRKQGGSSGSSPSAATSPGPGGSASTPSTTPRKTASAKRGLSPTSPTATILSEFIKDRNFAALIKIVGYAKAKEMIDKSKGKPHLAAMIKSFNDTGKLQPRQIDDLVKKSGVKLDEATDKRVKRFLSDIAWRR